MKTYLFIRVLINLHWLLLFTLLGLLTNPIYNQLFPEKMIINSIIGDDNKLMIPTISPEMKNTIAVGKNLFRTKCASCHNKDMKTDMIGPALIGVRERWSEFPESDLYLWIKNSSNMIESEHPRAVEISNKWKGSTMNAFNELTEKEIEILLIYIESVE